MPKGARRLPQRCIELISAADSVIHAGDFTSTVVLEEIEALCPRVFAVHGNVDEPALQSALPSTEEVTIAGKRLVVLHDGGPAQGRLERLDGRFPEAAAVVFGHSHLPLLEAEDGFQIFNPGSPTERRRSPRPSMGLLHHDGDELRFEHVWL
jgi:hypothetical protein